MVRISTWQQAAAAGHQVMSDEENHKTRAWMWCVGLVVLYLASYAPVDVLIHHHGYGPMSIGLVPPDPFAAPPPPPPRWMEVIYAPAKSLYNWRLVQAPMDFYYYWWERTL